MTTIDNDVALVLVWSSLSHSFLLLSSRCRGLDPQRGYTSDALSPDHPGYVVGGAINGQQQVISVAQSQQQQQRGGGVGVGVGATTATPTMQQRIKPLGVATPLVMASPVRR